MPAGREPAGPGSGSWRVAVRLVKGKNVDMAPNHHKWSPPVAGWGPCDPTGGSCVLATLVASDERWSLDRADPYLEADLEQHLGIGRTLKGRKVLGLLTKHPSEAR